MSGMDRPTGQQLEAVFFAALRAQDMQGVVDALRVMAPIDPTRAARLHADLVKALDIAQAVSGARGITKAGVT